MPKSILKLKKDKNAPLVVTVFDADGQSTDITSKFEGLRTIVRKQLIESQIVFTAGTSSFILETPPDTLETERELIPTQIDILKALLV